jgi:hypothetical protein
MQIDYLNPDYDAIFKERSRRIIWLRNNPSELYALKQYYKLFPAQFIIDWGVTYDPKNIERGLPALIPFILFNKQVEWVDEIVSHWQTQRPMLTEKTRQMGMSWLSIALSCTLCIFNPEMSIGFGSRKEEYVDKIGDPKTLFHKARTFLQYIPREFLGDWDILKNAPYMRIMFTNGSIMTGEAGDNIGRGATTSMYFVDEASFLERPKLIDASLSQTTNCRMDISTPNGMGNSFAERRFSGKIDVFTFHWRDDPRKNDEWYDKQVAELDPVTVAQELDINYSASVEGVVIPSAWVQSSIDAHIKLGFEATGRVTGALDVADEGIDMNALTIRKGVLLSFAEFWSGENGDIFKSVQKTFDLCRQNSCNMLLYDADGLGAGVRGDARIINEQQPSLPINVSPFRGSGAIVDPEREMVKGRKNKDYFANAKAQAWWSLRLRFQDTYRAVVEGADIDKDRIISISSNLINLNKIMAELSQPTYSVNLTGKIVINKKPDGTKSPNLADAIMINYAPTPRKMVISDALAAEFIETW